MAGLTAIKRKSFGGGGTYGSSDRGYQGGGRNTQGSVSGTAPGAAPGPSGNEGNGNTSVVNVQKVQANIKKAKEIEKIKQAEKAGFFANRGVPNYQKGTNYFTNANQFAKNKLNKFRQKSMQKAIQRTKDANLEELGMIDSQYSFGIGGVKIPSFLSGAASAFKVDPNTKYFDEGSIREIGGRLSATQPKGITSNQTKTLADLKEDIQFENNPNISQKDFNEYINRNKIPVEDNDNNLPYLPINYNTGAAEVVEPYTNDFTYRFGNEQKVGRDVTDATYAADGGIMGTRARRAMGGIMGRVDQRQQFFLGGIGKAIKGAFSGVVDATKKVLKSPIGQAALIYAGGSYLGGSKMFGGTGKLGFMERIASPSNFKNLFMNSDKGIFGRAKGLKDKYDDMGTFGRMATMGGIGLGLSMIPGLNKAKPNETNFQDRGGPLLNSQGDGSQGSISREIQDAYASGDSQRIMELQKYYNYMLPSQNAVQDLSLPSSLPYPNYAEGGRIGKAEGGLLNMGGMENCLLYTSPSPRD